jgi:hypothetical protein
MSKSPFTFRKKLGLAGLAMSAAALVVTGCGGASNDQGADRMAAASQANNSSGLPPMPNHLATIRISTLSSQPDRVTGRDVLLQIELLEQKNGGKKKDLVVTVNGRDVTAAFEENLADGKLVGTVHGLRFGENIVTAKYGNFRTDLSLTAYPITGPVISGPHEKPFYCGTTTFTRIGTSGGLGEPLDENCSANTRIDYYYRNTSGGNTRLSNIHSLTEYPSNMRYITVNGKTVPYLVRLESGTINRAIYQSAILHDVLNEPIPSPLHRPAGWNGKLIYPLGGGCQGGWYKQGNDFGTLITDQYIARGYALTTSTLNVMGTNCNDLLSSETVAMVKERFIKAYGVPTYTVGTGGSGGAYQSHQTADNYPGLFDGIIVWSVFPDVTSSTIFKLHDSRVLNTYFDANPGYTDEQKKAISGYLQVNNIRAMSNSAGRLDPVVSFPSEMPADVRYHPVNNPTGARATVYDHTVNVYGKTAEGFALRPLDNVGVQYGLKALNDGVISVEQFLDLNEKVGGVDRDLKPTATRTEGDLDAIRRTYQSGRIANGGGGLASTAIIDLRDYYDNAINGDIHNKIHSYSVRERLVKANGHIGNHVMLAASRTSGVRDGYVGQMDRWLMAVLSDASDKTKAQKVGDNRPADLVDACWDSAGNKIVEKQTAFEPSACNTLYPAGTTPRMVAGGPLADDIVKCQLKPLDYADYKVTIDAGQWARLQTVFPNGVCDWNKPGVEQQPLKGTWLSFGPSPVNQLFDITRP